MNPVIFDPGPIVVRWYGVMMALTILTSIVFATRWGPRFGIDRAFIDRITFWLAIVLFAGARVGYVVSHPWGCPAPSPPAVRDDSRGDRPGHRVAGRPAARLSRAGVVDDRRPDLDRAHLPGRAAQGGTRKPGARALR